MGEQRQTSLNLINNMPSWADTSDINLVLYYQCILTNELSVINGDANWFADSILFGCKDMLPNLDYPVLEGAGKRSFAKAKPKLVNPTVSDINFSKAQISIYPNPILDNLNISLENIENGTQINFQIIDIVGDFIQKGTYTVKVKNSVLNIPLNLNPGTYFIKFEGEQINETKRFSVLK